MSSRDLEPQDQATNLDDRSKGGQILGIARCDAAPLLEVQERIFDEVTQAIQVFVEVARRLAVLAGRNLRPHSLVLCLLDNRVAVVAFIGDQVLRAQAFDQG